MQRNETVNFSNFLDLIPEQVHDEIFQNIINTGRLKIERIISHGQSSPETGWYDQEENEWVMVMEGEAIIEFEDHREVRLGKNDFLFLKSHRKHRVKWTTPDKKTIWLAIHF